jgi:hypothetical protein
VVTTIPVPAVVAVLSADRCKLRLALTTLLLAAAAVLMGKAVENPPPSG